MKSALQMKQRIQSLQPHAAIKQAHGDRTFYRTKHPKPMKQKSTSYKSTSSKRKTPTSKGAEKSLSAKKRPKSAAKNVKPTAKPSKTHSSKSTKTLKIEKALRALAAARVYYDKIPPEIREKAIDAAVDRLNRQEKGTEEKIPQKEIPRDAEGFSLGLFSNSFDEAEHLCSGLFGDNFYWQGRPIMQETRPLHVAVSHIAIGDVSDAPADRRSEAALVKADLVFAAVDGGAASLSRATTAFCKWILSTAYAGGTPVLFVVLNAEENLTCGHESVSHPGMRRRWADLMKRRKTVFAKAIGCGRDQLIVVSRVQEVGLPVVAKHALLLVGDQSKKRLLANALLPDLIQISPAPAASVLRKFFKGATSALKEGGRRTAHWVRDNPESAAELAKLIRDALRVALDAHIRSKSGPPPKRRASTRKR